MSGGVFSLFLLARCMHVHCVTIMLMWSVFVYVRSDMPPRLRTDSVSSHGSHRTVPSTTAGTDHSAHSSDAESLHRCVTSSVYSVRVQIKYIMVYGSFNFVTECLLRVNDFHT